MHQALWARFGPAALHLLPKKAGGAFPVWWQRVWPGSGPCPALIFRFPASRGPPLEAKKGTAVPESGRKHSLVLNLRRERRVSLDVFIRRCGPGPRCSSGSAALNLLRPTSGGAPTVGAGRIRPGKWPCPFPCHITGLRNQAASLDEQCVVMDLGESLGPGIPR